MVKGMTRRVIVVKPPDRRLFEEAVFFLREDAEAGVSGDDIIAEARAVADSFVRENLRGAFPRLRAPLWAAAGALTASAVWAFFLFIR
ncbi:MAG: translation initiation factor 2 [Oscillospiraceae bacterium]|jgi:hypothetical protein|nr:translation initiation factor 2 [Oscillospiraceae bacterium]